MTREFYLVRFIVLFLFYTLVINKNKEELSMKTAVCKNCQPMNRIPYPNAATGREILHKTLDAALVAACGMGVAAMVLLGLVL